MPTGLRAMHAPLSHADMRVRLLPLGDDDGALLAAVFGDAETLRHWSHAPLRTPSDIAWYLRDAAAGAMNGSYWRWSIRRATDDGPVGIASLHGLDDSPRCVEISYVLTRAHWGNGYARDAVRLLVEHALRHGGFGRIEARVDGANLRSRRLLDRLGFDEVRARRNGDPENAIRFVLES